MMLLLVGVAALTLTAGMFLYGVRTSLDLTLPRRYIITLVTPLEQAVAARARPCALTLAGLLVAAAGGVFGALGWFGCAASACLAAGILDILDGRVARRTGQVSPSGALLDSVCDRWGELAFLGGLAFALPGWTGLAATLLCIGGAQMVSYTRARLEALGAASDDGFWQRPVRVAVLAGGLFAAGAAGHEHGSTLAMVTLATVGVGACGTAVGRLVRGVFALGVSR